MAAAQTQFHHYSQPFTPLTDPEFFYFTQLGREDLLVAYLELKRHCWAGKNTCWPSEERQAEETGRKVATVRRRLQDLEALGVIRVIRPAESKRRGNRYILTQLEEWKAPHELLPKKSARSLSPDPDRGRSGSAPSSNGIKNWVKEGLADPAPAVHTDHPRSPDPDRRRSPKQIDARKPDPGETNNRALITQRARDPMVDRRPGIQDVVVPANNSSKPQALPESGLRLDLQTEVRLKALGATINWQVVSRVLHSDPGVVDRALACLEAARKIENPTGYFLAALKGRWSPPASFMEAKARKEAEAEARRHRERIDDLARIWGCRVGMALEDLAGEIQSAIARSRQSQAERVRKWGELGRFSKAPEQARGVESEHDERVQRAVMATLDAGLAVLLRSAGVALSEVSVAYPFRG